MTQTVIAKYSGLVTRREDGTTVQFHRFSDVLKAESVKFEAEQPTKSTD